MSKSTYHSVESKDNHWGEIPKILREHTSPKLEFVVLW